MLKTINQLLFFISCLAFIGCDPPHNIQFKNETDSELQVTLLTKPEVGNLDLLRFNELKKGDSIILNIQPKSESMLHFGIGSWSEGEIESLANSLQQISFENDDFSKVYKSNKGIKKLLDNNKCGFWWRSEIIIKVE